MPANDVELRIIANDSTRAGFAAANREVDRFAKNAQRSFAGMRSSITAVKALLTGFFAHQAYRLTIKPALDRQVLRSQLAFLTRDTAAAMQQIRLASLTGAKGAGEGAKALLAGGAGLGQLQNLSKIAAVQGQEVGKVVAKFLEARKDLFAGKRPDLGGMGLSQAGIYSVSRAGTINVALEKLEAALLNAAKAADADTSDAAKLRRARAELEQRLTEIGGKLLPLFTKLTEVLASSIPQLVAFAGALIGGRVAANLLNRAGGNYPLAAPVLGQQTAAPLPKLNYNAIRSAAGQQLIQTELAYQMASQQQRMTPQGGVVAGVQPWDAYRQKVAAQKVMGSMGPETPPTPPSANARFGASGLGQFAGTVAISAGIGLLAFQITRIVEELGKAADAAEKFGARVNGIDFMDALREGTNWLPGLFGREWKGTRQMELSTKAQTPEEARMARMQQLRQQRIEAEAKRQLELEDKMAKEAPGKAQDFIDLSPATGYRSKNEVDQLLDLKVEWEKINQFVQEYGNLIPVEKMEKLVSVMAVLKERADDIEALLEQWDADLADVLEAEEKLMARTREYQNLLKKQADLERDLAEAREEGAIRALEKELKLLRERNDLVKANLAVEQGRADRTMRELDRNVDRNKLTRRERREADRAEEDEQKQFEKRYRRGQQALKNMKEGRAVSEQGSRDADFASAVDTMRRRMAMEGVVPETADEGLRRFIGGRRRVARDALDKRPKLTPEEQDKAVKDALERVFGDIDAASAAGNIQRMQEERADRQLKQQTDALKDALDSSKIATKVEDATKVLADIKRNLEGLPGWQNAGKGVK